MKWQLARITVDWDHSKHLIWVLAKPPQTEPFIREYDNSIGSGKVFITNGIHPYDTTQKVVVKQETTELLPEFADNVNSISTFEQWLTMSDEEVRALAQT